MEGKEQLIQSLIDEGYLKTSAIIDAFREIDRADFVLPEYLNQAYGNYPLPIGEGQTISQPLTVAFMLELLNPRAGENVLDIGAGSGWQAALLAHIVGKNESGIRNQESGKVTAIELVPTLCDFAKRNLEKYGFLEDVIVTLYCQDATQEISDGRYDKIMVAAAAKKEIPRRWRDALKVGGRIVAPIDGSVWLFIKKSETEWEEKEFPGFAFVPLVNGKSQEATIPPHGARLAFGGKNQGSKKRWYFSVLASCFLLLASFFAYEVYLPHPASPEPKKIVIPAGMGSRAIGTLLKKEGVIRSKWVFVTYVVLDFQASQLKPGTYIFANAAIPEIADILVHGVTNERIITIPEGWSLGDIGEYLGSEGVAAPAVFKKVVDSAQDEKWSARFSFLQDRPRGAGLQGYLFPDTYRIYADASPDDIVAKMLGNFDKKVTSDLRNETKSQGKTLFAEITMASLIEKEVISDADRAIVSGILWKRLDAGIPLQVDATVIYIKNQKSRIKNQGGHEKISLQDTKIESPYNTYRYRGLPPGPIANPGLSAIRAAMNPVKSSYLYYLSAPDGRTIFSKTLDEHNAAKAKYLAS